MSVTFNRFLEITFILILVFLVVANAGDFAKVVGALSNAYSQSVKVLQGR